MDRSRLVVLIPAYREAGTIGGVVTAARRFAPVIVVDDCSPDATGEAAREAGAQVHRNAANLGYDGTLNQAFELAREGGYGCAVTMDADGEHDPALIERFAELLCDRDVPLVLGIRPRKQRLAELVMGLYVKARLGVDDILCGMKGYHLDLLAANGRFDTSDSIGTELAINSIRRGARFEQIPVSGTPRADAPRFDRRLRANWRILSALWRVFRQDATGRPTG